MVLKRVCILGALLLGGCASNTHMMRVEYVGETTTPNDQLYVCAQTEAGKLYCVEYREFLKDLQKHMPAADAGTQLLRAQP